MKAVNRATHVLSIIGAPCSKCGLSYNQAAAVPCSGMTRAEVDAKLEAALARAEVAEQTCRGMVAGALALEVRREAFAAFEKCLRDVLQWTEAKTDADSMAIAHNVREALKVGR